MNPMICTEDTSFCGILTKNASYFNHERTLDKPKVKDVVQNN